MLSRPFSPYFVIVWAYYFSLHTCIISIDSNFVRRILHVKYQALLNQNIWKLIPYAPDQRILGYKWIFRLKRDSASKVVKHKARLVANGYHQQPGIDFVNTFSLVIKMITIHFILYLSLHYKWGIHLLDVKNVFLHGHITKQIHMSQPPGFVDKLVPNHVYFIQKAIYGLRQTPKAQYDRVSQFLFSQGFKVSLCK